MTHHTPYRWILLMALVIAGLPSTRAILAPSRSSMASPTTLLLNLRGGGGESAKKSKSSKSKRSKPVVEEVEEEEETEDETEEEEEEEEETEEEDEEMEEARTAINEAMKEKDAAEALGDAIRDRKDILRGEDPLLQSIDWSVGSLGKALGASDLRREGGGVQAAQSSVIANYFLKSHGGAHALQSLCSALATLSGVGALGLLFLARKQTGTPKALAYVMMQRTILFAMFKHLSGMLAAASIAAKAVPKIGLSQARQWMEQLVVDPVSQYVFFTALLLVWMPSKQRIVEGACWWWNKGLPIPLLLLSPILLREGISNLLVISDVLVLWSVGEEDPSVSAGIQTVLKVSQSVVNAVMSLLVTPDKWRSADPAQRQTILAKLVGKVSLVLEVLIGAVLAVDALAGTFGAAFLSGAKRPPLSESVMRLVCVRLYLHFLWIRRSQIKKVGLEVRGGASQLPLWVLETLTHPGNALGIQMKDPHLEDEEESHSWREYMVVGLGLNPKEK